MGSQPSPKETKTAYARLDSLRGVIDGRERVVCGQQNRDGRYVCSQDIGYVKVSYRGTLREYCLWPGWLRYDDGGWRPINYAVQQVRKGYRPKFRSDALTRSQGDHFGEPFQPG